METVKDEIYKVCVLGDIGVGKTALCNRLKNDTFVKEYKSTIGVNFSLKVIKEENITTRLQLWDIAGQERFGNMTRVYYREAQGAFIMCDCTRSSTIDAIKKWKSDIDNKVDWNKFYPDGTNPCVLLVNMSDRYETDGVKDIDFDKMCKEYGFHKCFQISCKTGEGIQEACDYMVEILKTSVIPKIEDAKVVPVPIKEKEEEKKPNILLLLDQIFKITNNHSDDKHKIFELKSLYLSMYLSEISKNFFDELKQNSNDVDIIRQIHCVLIDNILNDEKKVLNIQTCILDYGLKRHSKPRENNQNTETEEDDIKNLWEFLTKIFNIVKLDHDNDKYKISRLKEIFLEMYLSTKSDEFIYKLNGDNFDIIRQIHCELIEQNFEDKDQCLLIQTRILDYGLKYHTKG